MVDPLSGTRTDSKVCPFCSPELVCLSRAPSRLQFLCVGLKPGPQEGGGSLLYCGMKENPAESVWSEEWTMVWSAGADAQMRSTGTQEEPGLHRLKWRSAAAFFVVVGSLFVE